MTTIGMLKLDTDLYVSNDYSLLELDNSSTLVIDTKGVSNYETFTSIIDYIQNLNLYSCLWVLNTDTQNTNKVNSLKKISNSFNKVYYYEREKIQ